MSASKADTAEGQEPAAAEFQRAVKLHQQGKFAEAEPIYRAVLARAPAHFDALHLLGVIHLQGGDPGTAADLIARAVAVNSSVAAAHSNLGNALRQLKRPEDALMSYDRALRLDETYAEAFNNRGNVLLDLGRPAEALSSY